VYLQIVNQLLISSLRNLILNYIFIVILQTGHDRSADIWSVGCTVIEMYTGKPPFSELATAAAVMFRIASTQEPPVLPDFVSDIAREFLSVCFHRNPQDRATADQLLQHKWLEGVMTPSELHQLLQAEQIASFNSAVALQQNHHHQGNNNNHQNLQQPQAVIATVPNNVIPPPSIQQQQQQQQQLQTFTQQEETHVEEVGDEDIALNDNTDNTLQQQNEPTKISSLEMFDKSTTREFMNNNISNNSNNTSTNNQLLSTLVNTGTSLPNEYTNNTNNNTSNTIESATDASTSVKATVVVQPKEGYDSEESINQYLRQRSMWHSRSFTKQVEMDVEPEQSLEQSQADEQTCEEEVVVEAQVVFDEIDSFPVNTVQRNKSTTPSSSNSSNNKMTNKVSGGSQRPNERAIESSYIKEKMKEMNEIESEKIKKLQEQQRQFHLEQEEYRRQAVKDQEQRQTPNQQHVKIKTISNGTNSSSSASNRILTRNRANTAPTVKDKPNVAMTSQTTITTTNGTHVTNNNNNSGTNVSTSNANSSNTNNINNNNNNRIVVTSPTKSTPQRAQPHQLNAYRTPDKIPHSAPSALPSTQHGNAAGFGALSSSTPKRLSGSKRTGAKGNVTSIGHIQTSQSPVPSESPHNSNNDLSQSTKKKSVKT